MGVLVATVFLLQPSFAQIEFPAEGYRPNHIYYIDSEPDPDSWSMTRDRSAIPDWERWGSFLDTEITQIVSARLEKKADTIGHIPRSCQFEFIITNNKEIESVTILKSSMNTKFDALVTTAIKEMERTSVLVFPFGSERKSVLMKTWVHCQGKNACTGKSWKDLVKGDCTFYVHKASDSKLESKMQNEKEIHNRTEKIRKRNETSETGSLSEVSKPTKDAAPFHDDLFDWQFENPSSERESKRILDPLIEVSNKRDIALWAKTPKEVARQTLSVDRKFEESLWSSTQLKWTLRPYMFGAFAAEYGLIGMKKTRLHELLGEPDSRQGAANRDPYRPDSEWYRLYYGSPEPSALRSARIVYLEIAFDEEEKVSGYRLMVRTITDASPAHFYRLMD